MITKTLEEVAFDEVEVQKTIVANKAKPKISEETFNGKVVERTEISDDGRIVIVRTNPNGL